MSTIARAVLTSGSQHEDVHALGRLLADAGHENSVSRGENPFGLVDESILTAAASYRQQHKLDPEDSIPGVPTHEQTRWIGPTLWDALLPPLDAPASEPEPQTPAKPRSSRSRSRTSSRSRSSSKAKSAS
jgi:hypothetical protein